MYELAKSARDALKAKARRLAGEKDTKTDSSSVKRPAAFTADKKTGLQPTTRRAYKKGGAVKKEAGGSLPPPAEAAQSEARMKTIKVQNDTESVKLPSPKEAAARSGKAPQDVPGRKHGGRTAKKGGGGLTVINIGGKDGQPATVGAPGAAMAPPPAPPMAPPMAPPAAPGGQPPMMQKAGFKKGGRISKVASSYKDMQAGAGNGEGRLQKTDIAKKRKGAPKA
jgi:hypothetical protein